MKAFLLAGGRGTRLRPLTDVVPKCLIPVGGTPLLYQWLDKLSDEGVDWVIVNTHHLREQVSWALAERERAGEGSRCHVREFHEPELLGSAGTLVANRGWVADESEFVVAYCDTVLDFALAPLVETHRRSGALVTMALFHTPNPSACGVCALSERGMITEYVEKPCDPPSDLANAGLYVVSPAAVPSTAPHVPYDLGHDLLPQLVGRMAGYVVRGYVRDLGTREAYEAAQEDARIGRWPWPTATRGPPAAIEH